jgi:toxin FitB
MFLLDTNVVSELRKSRSGRANPGVVAWASGNAAGSLYLSAITLLELETGVLLVERREPAQGATLRVWMQTQVLPAFARRVLPIDERVALRCAALHVPNRVSERDALIAATALVHDLTVVTRNVVDFKPCKVRLLNPWQV